MESILTIDQGNSRVKLAIYAKGVGVKSKIAERLTPDALISMCEGQPIMGVIYSSVGKSGEDVEKMLRAVCNKVLILTHSTPLPIGVEYTTRSTLGLDRIAAAVGGLTLYPDKRLVIADAGTALTVDVTDGKRGFIGGNISAGITMRLRALHNYTARLPEVEAAGATPIIGYDTVTALRSGAVRGAAAEIVLTAQHSGADLIILTGGDGQMLEKYVKEITGIRTEEVRDLVSCGLLRIYEYNENKL